MLNYSTVLFLSILSMYQDKPESTGLYAIKPLTSMYQEKPNAYLYVRKQTCYILVYTSMYAKKENGKPAWRRVQAKDLMHTSLRV